MGILALHPSTPSRQEYDKLPASWLFRDGLEQTQSKLSDSKSKALVMGGLQGNRIRQNGKTDYCTSYEPVKGSVPTALDRGRGGKWNFLIISVASSWAFFS